jgi:hypothetical protein
MLILLLFTPVLSLDCDAEQGLSIDSDGVEDCYDVLREGIAFQTVTTAIAALQELILQDLAVQTAKLVQEELCL